MADVTGASLQPIYDRLNQVPKHHPMEAQTFRDWTMEAGDVITMERDGDSYQGPVHQTRMTWRGSAETQIVSQENEEREAVTKASQRRYGRGSSLRNSSYQHWYVDDMYGQMRSGLILTGSTAALYARSLYGQMVSGLKLTSSSAALYVRDMYNQMTSGLQLTSSSAALYVRDMYNQMTSGLQLTSSSAALYVRDMYNQMTSGLQLTSSSAALYVRDMYRQMTSGLQLTSSSAALYVLDMYRQMTSGLELTSSSAALYVRDMYRQMTSGLNLTSSSAALYVRDMYRQMTSGLNLTSSSAALYVRDMYRNMTSGLNLTSSSATLYAATESSAARITTKINAAGQGEAIIEADHITLAGYTNADSAAVALLYVDAFHFKTGTTPYGTGAYQSIMSTPKMFRIHSDDGNVTYKLQVQLYQDSSETWHDVAGSDSFSRATLMSGNWSGGTFTVTADPNGTSSVSVAPVIHISDMDSDHKTYLSMHVATYDGGTYDDHGNRVRLYLVYNSTNKRYELNSMNQPSTAGAGVITYARIDGQDASYTGHTFRCTSVEPTYPGSTTNRFTFTIEGNYGFSQGSNYDFYRTNWP